jgi:hypothetical protein
MMRRLAFLPFLAPIFLASTSLAQGSSFFGTATLLGEFTQQESQTRDLEPRASSGENVRILLNGTHTLSTVDYTQRLTLGITRSQKLNFDEKELRSDLSGTSLWQLSPLLAASFSLGGALARYRDPLAPPITLGLIKNDGQFTYYRSLDASAGLTFAITPRIGLFVREALQRAISSRDNLLANTHSLGVNVRHTPITQSTLQGSLARTYFTTGQIIDTRGVSYTLNHELSRLDAVSLGYGYTEILDRTNTSYAESYSAALSHKTEELRYGLSLSRGLAYRPSTTTLTNQDSVTATFSGSPYLHHRLSGALAYTMERVVYSEGEDPLMNVGTARLGWAMDVNEKRLGREAGGTLYDQLTLDVSGSESLQQATRLRRVTTSLGYTSVW